MSRKRLNNILKGANGSSVVVSLDTAGPLVDVTPFICTPDELISFDFDLVSDDTAYFKTWGDYNTVSGRNHDLCGTTEANAPWVSIQEHIDFSLNNLDPSAYHDFYFKFRDDVWNETYVPVEKVFDRTVLIDVEDLIQSKDVAVTFTLDVDDVSSQEMSEMDVVLVDKFDFITSDVRGSIDMHHHMYETGDSFSEALHQIALEDLGDTYEPFVMNVALSDASNPYTVFYYFAVKIYERSAGEEISIFSQGLFDFVDFSETNCLLPVLTEKFIATEFVDHIDAKLLQKDTSVKADFSLVTTIETDDLFVSETKVVPELKLPEIGKYLLKQRSDVDAILYENVNSNLEADLIVPADLVSVSDEFGIVDPAQNDYFDSARAWSLVLDSKDKLTGNDLIIFSLFSDFMGTSYESGILNMAFSDKGVYPDPTWVFTVNSIDMISSWEKVIESISGEDLIFAIEDAIPNVFYRYNIKISDRAWADADQLMFDAGTAVDVFDMLIPPVEDSVLIENTVQDVLSMDYYGSFEGTSFEKNLWDAGTGTSVNYFYLSGEDYFTSLEDSVVMPYSTVDYKFNDKLDYLDEDILIKDAGIGSVNTLFYIPVDELVVPEEYGVIEVWGWHDGVAKFKASINDIPPEPVIVYVYGFDEGFGKYLRTTIENRLLDPVFASEVPILDLCSIDIPYFTDVLIEFHKKLKENPLTFEDKSYLMFFENETANVSVSPYISTCGLDTFTYKDILSEFEKKIKEKGIGYEPESTLDLVSADVGDVLSSAVLSILGSDRIKFRDFLSFFEKMTPEFAHYKEDLLIDQFISDTGLLYETGYINFGLFDSGEYKETYKLLVTIDLHEKGDFKLKLVTSLAGQEFIYSDETALLLPVLFDVGETEESTSFRTYLRAKEKPVVFDTSAVNILGKDNLRIYFDVVLNLAEKEIGYPEFYCEVKEVVPIIYIDVYELFFSKDKVVCMDLLGTDDAVLVEQGVVSVVNTEIGHYADFTIHDRKFSMFENSDICFNTIIYDPTIDYERDIAYWWEPAYSFGTGAIPSSVTVNPDWAKDIVPGDIDYPYYKNDALYGTSVSPFGYTKTLRASEDYIVTDNYYRPAGGSHYLGQTYSWLIRLSISRLELIEKYLVTVQDIPWTSSFEYRIKYYRHHRSGGIDIVTTYTHIVPVNLVEVSHYWTFDNVRHTVYTFDPSESVVDLYRLFIHYYYSSYSRLDLDYFEIELYSSFRWLKTTTYKGQGTVQYIYTGGLAEVTSEYSNLRRALLYDLGDSWFKPLDISYYEPTVYKLYLNLECGVVPEYDRIPESAMDNFVLDKMRHYSKLDIVAPYLGDHAVVSEDPIIWFEHKINVHYTERWEIYYTLNFVEQGFACEDTLIYSQSDFQDREFLFWWQKNYPAKDTTTLIPNPLLGYPIYMDDFDYPFEPYESGYGLPIYPKKIIRDADFDPYSDNSLVNYRVYPLAELTDGVSITLSGSLYTLNCNAQLELVVANLIPPISSPDFIIRNHFYSFGVIAASQEGRYVNLDYNASIRYQDFLNANISGQFNDKHYVCVLVRELNSEISHQFELKFHAEVEEYDPVYLSYRKKGMYPNDGEFITTDFYPDLFKFKFYVNLGCGPDIDAFPVPYKNDFERWIYTKARQGDYDLDYLFLGDDGRVDPLTWVELFEDHTIHVNFHWYFNDLEINVFEYGAVEIAQQMCLLADDSGQLIENSPLFNFDLSIVANLSYKLVTEATFTVREYGTFEVTPLFDLFSADVNESFMENSVLFLNKDIDLTLDFNLKMLVKVTLYEQADLDINDLTSMFLSDSFLIQDNSTSITLPMADDAVSDELNRMIEFIYVFENGSFVGMPLLNEPLNHFYSLLEYPELAVALGYIGTAKERIWPDRTEFYFDFGYVCFWVQVERYPYVIDWLAGHYVDYVVNPLEVEYLRFTTCFGIPPGNWPPVSNYPSEKILPDPRIPHLTKNPKYPHAGYRRKSTQPSRTDRGEYMGTWGKGGYIRTPGPGNKTTYIINPADPPGPYKWDGGTAAFLTKSIMDRSYQNPVMVSDAFFFALFDEDNNMVSRVHTMTIEQSVDEDGSVIPGNSFGAMVFFDLEPNTTYYVRETDEHGNLLTASITSSYSGNKYVLPQGGLKVTTGADGECVDAGNMDNLVDSLGPGNLKPLPVRNDNYKPMVYADDNGGGSGGGQPYGQGISPFRIPGYGSSGTGEIPYGSFPPQYIPPYVDGEYYPPIIPPQYDPDMPDYNPVDAPGFEGKLNYLFEFAYARDESVTNIPVEMLSVIWEYHYIPATFVMELSGMGMDFYDGYLFELSEPFRFETDSFGFDFEEPFKFETDGFYIGMEKGFAFDECPFELSTSVHEFALDEVKFEFEAQFETVKFDWVDFDGEQKDALPQVIPSLLVYNGEEQKLCTTGGLHGTIFYQVDDSNDWSTEIPKRIQAGSYVVKWYAMASLYYRGYGSEENYMYTTCVIQQSPAEFDVDMLSIEYDSEEIISFYYIGDGRVSCHVNDILSTCEIISQEAQPVDKGSLYLIKARLRGISCGTSEIVLVGNSGENYQHVEKTVLCRVNAATMSFIVSPVDVDYTGDAPVANIEVFGPTEYTILYSLTPITDSTTDLHTDLDFCKDVGEYTVYFVIKATNYAPVYGKFNLTVNRAWQDIHLVPYNGVYDEQPHPLITAVEGVFGTMWYSLDNINWSAEIPQATVPDDYVIYWYCVGDKNHYDMGTAEYPNAISALIDKKEIDTHIDNIVIDIASSGSVVVDIPTPSTGRMLANWSDYEVISCTLSGLTVIIDALAIGGSFVYIRQAADDFYKAHTFSFYVEVISTQIVYDTFPVVVYYTGTGVSETGINIYNPSPDVCTVKYSKSPITPTSHNLAPSPKNFYIDAGEYTIYFVISAYGYTPAYGSYPLIINKAHNTAPKLLGYNAVYDGKYHDAFAVIESAAGKLYSRLPDATKYIPSIVRIQLVGEYDIPYYYDGGRNFESYGSPDDPYFVHASIYKMTINSKTVYYETDITRVQSFSVFVHSPSNGKILRVEFSTDAYIDPKQISWRMSQAFEYYYLHVSLVGVMPGHFTMRLLQAESMSYYEHWFDFDITLTGHPTQPGRFFKLMGENCTQSGYFSEVLDRDYLLSLPNTGYYPWTSYDFNAVFINFYDLIDVNHQIEYLTLNSFVVGKYDGVLNDYVIIQFITAHGVQKWGSTTNPSYMVGIYDENGQPYTTAEPFLRQFIDDPIIQVPNALMRFAIDYKPSEQKAILYMYSMNSQDSTSVRNWVFKNSV